MTLLSRSWRGRFGRWVRRVTAVVLGPVLAAAGAVLPGVPAVAVAAGVTAAAAAASVATASPAHAQSGVPVLVLAQNGEATAPEATLLQAAGYAVTQVTPSVWAGMSTAAFEGYSERSWPRFLARLGEHPVHAGIEITPLNEQGQPVDHIRGTATVAVERDHLTPEWVCFSASVPAIFTGWPGLPQLQDWWAGFVQRQAARLGACAGGMFSAGRIGVAAGNSGHQ
jgi:hypothetical protein